MKMLRTLLWAFLACAACCQTARAIGAYPRPILVRQPDGTALTVRIQGNENFHYVTTADGYLLSKNTEGYFCYVDYDFTTGKKTLTAQRAHNLKDRTTGEKTLLSSLKTAGKVNADLLQRTSIIRKAPAQTLSPGLLTSSRGTLKDAQWKGDTEFLVILVNFTDSTFRHTATDFDRWLNETGYSVNGGTGSVRDYYRDNSMGQFTPNFHVVGPYTLAHPTKYYGENTSETSASDKNPRDMVHEACLLAKENNPDLDFSQFDNDKDGIVDNVYVIYAGYSEASTANDDDIWPHTWNMGTQKFQIDGVTINTYSCSAELVGMPGAPAEPSMDGIGTFAHEFGHVLGLKDMYDTDGETNGSAVNPGDYSMYASGSYNNDSHTPPCLMAFERMQLGWAQEGTDIVAMRDAEDVTLENLADNKARYIDAQPGRAAGTGVEWFIFENRQQTGWDKYIPAHGLLITHYDYTDEMVSTYWDVNGPNNNARHRCMYIVPADNIDDDNSRTGDTYPGSSANTSFTDTSKPAAVNWDNEALGVPVTHITESDGIIRFQVSGGVSQWDVVKTDVPTEIYDTLATFHADVVSHKADVTEVGFCWRQGTAEPTVDGDGCDHATVADATKPELTVKTLEPGSNYNVRSYMRLSDGTLVYGSSVPFATDCKTALTPFTSDFTSWTNGQPDCWRIVDNNGDGSTWVADESSNSICYTYNAWNDADDWLICRRRVHVPEHGVLFFTRGVSEETSIENLDVYVSTKSSSIDDFYLVDRFSFADYFSQQHMEEVDLSKYAGQDVYLAFRCTSEKLQGYLWLWDIIVTNKLATPTVTKFERKGTDQLHVEWTPVDGAAGNYPYYLYLGKETTEANQVALFTPMSYYENVIGDVSLGTGNLFFKSSGSVELKEIPEGIDDLKFIVTTSGPVGTSKLIVEGTKDGTHWQTVGTTITLKEYDSEGQECDFSSYVSGKKYKKLRFVFTHGGRNGRVKYLTLVYNDGMVYDDLAAGGVRSTQIDITEKTAGEFSSGKYMVWVAAGYYGLYFDESAPAYYQAATAVDDVIAGTGITLHNDGRTLTVGGLHAGDTVTCTTASGVVIYTGKATGDSLAVPSAGHRGVAIVTIDSDGRSSRTKTVFK